MSLHLTSATLAVDSSGNVYIADRHNQRIRMIGGATNRHHRRQWSRGILRRWRDGHCIYPCKAQRRQRRLIRQHLRRRHG